MRLTRSEKLVLRRLVKKGESDVYDLLGSQDLCVRDFLTVLKRMLSRGLLSLKNGVASLTPRGEKMAEDLGVKGAENVCKRCGGSGYVLGNDFRRALAKFKSILRNRPAPADEFDQKFITPEGVMLRVAFMAERGDLAGGRLFVVGDDDLLSVAAALTGAPRKVVVVDIDKRVVEFINTVGDELGLGVEAHTYDVRDPLPPRFQKRFDVFITDPTETVPALKLFLSRAAAALRGRGSAGYFGMTTIESSISKWRTLQQMVYEMGFVITDIRRDFSLYEETGESYRFPMADTFGHPSAPWYKSSLIRVEAASQIRPLVRGRIRLGKEFYFDAESRPITPAEMLEHR